MENRSSFGKVRQGTRLSETQYYEVLEVQKYGNPSIRVRNERGFEFTISAKIVEEGMYSADQFEEEKKITRTEMVEVLENAGDCIFTVNFNKQQTPKELHQKLKRYEVVSQKELAKLMQGEDRTLIGYLISVEPKMGRSQVIDLEVEGDGASRIRQVDHRTLNWLILKGVKYVVKG